MQIFNLLEDTKLFSKVALPVFTPTSKANEFRGSTFWPKLGIVRSSHFCQLKSMKWYLRFYFELLWWLARCIGVHMFSAHHPPFLPWDLSVHILCHFPSKFLVFGLLLSRNLNVFWILIIHQLYVFQNLLSLWFVLSFIYEWKFPSHVVLMCIFFYGLCYVFWAKISPYTEIRCSPMFLFQIWKFVSFTCLPRMYFCYGVKKGV